ncbi:hypothetical protein BH24DEI2_BH24DEI2_18290 [soil metagenome]
MKTVLRRFGIGLEGGLKMKNLKKVVRGGILVLSLMAVAVPAAYAQTDTTAPVIVDTPAVVDTTDDGFDWGWLGLLGLLGLAGLGGRNRRDVDVDRDRSVKR